MVSARFAFIYDGDEEVGDVALYHDGTASVMNYRLGLQHFFDDRETGHEDALRYIKTRMTPEPAFR